METNHTISTGHQPAYRIKEKFWRDDDTANVKATYYIEKWGRPFPFLKEQYVPYILLGSSSMGDVYDYWVQFSDINKAKEYLKNLLTQAIPKDIHHYL